MLNEAIQQCKRVEFIWDSRTKTYWCTVGWVCMDNDTTPMGALIKALERAKERTK